jgi:hypothetical protein
MRILVVISLISTISCNYNTDPCRPNIFVEQSEETLKVDKISQDFKECILDDYSGYSYKKECSDSVGAQELFNLLNQRHLLSSKKIISVEILPKLESFSACEPLIYVGSRDSVLDVEKKVADKSKYCNRSYHFLKISGEPTTIEWNFLTPLIAGLSNYKVLEIYHQSLNYQNGSTLIIRIWYKDI